MKTLTIADAVRRTGFSRHAIRQAIERGELTHYKPSPESFRIPEHSLEAWVRSKKRGGA